MSDRIKKLNDLIRDEVARILSYEFEKEDGILVTVIGADVSPTLEHATIKVSIFPKNQETIIIKEIQKQIYRVQQLLNKRLSMRPVPKIRFEIDKTMEYASKIDELFKNL